MIAVRCRTNLDDYARVTWPAEMLALPRVGDRVMSLDHKHSLRVIEITHACFRKLDGRTTVPCVLVELHR